MKRNTFAIALIAFAATTAAVGTAVASLVPSDLVVTPIYVRKTETIAPTTAVPLIFAGNYDITTPGSNDVVVTVQDNRPGGTNPRKGRTTADVILTTTSTTALPSSIVIN
jgi:hypothetical protein